jgi:hypothetical protein
MRCFSFIHPKTYDDLHLRLFCVAAAAAVVVHLVNDNRTLTLIVALLRWHPILGGVPQSLEKTHRL